MPDRSALSAASPADATRLVLAGAAPLDFEILLQGGFFVPVEGVCTVREFLCEQMEICGAYAKDRIQTLFLNGSVVDDLDDSWVREGSRLALSAAMPGLVGATMRRGGVYAAMREGITYQPRKISLHQDTFLIEVRLYNFIARELAEQFLTRGVWLRTPDLLHFLRGRPVSFFEGMTASLDGRPLPGRFDPDRLEGLRPLTLLRLERPAAAARRDESGTESEAGRDDAPAANRETAREQDRTSSRKSEPGGPPEETVRTTSREAAR